VRSRVEEHHARRARRRIDDEHVAEVERPVDDMALVQSGECLGNRVKERQHLVHVTRARSLQ